MVAIKFDSHWRGGLGAIDRANGLTNAFEESAHALAYASEPQAGGAEAPGYIYGHLASLYSGISYLAEALDKMAYRVTDLAVVGAMYHDSHGDVGQSAAESVRGLMNAAAAARELTNCLQAAQNAIAHLGLHSDVNERVWAAYGDGS